MKSKPLKCIEILKLLHKHFEDENIKDGIKERLESDLYVKAVDDMTLRFDDLDLDNRFGDNTMTFEEVLLGGDKLNDILLFDVLACVDAIFLSKIENEK